MNTRWMVALAAGAFLTLALAVMVTSTCFGETDTAFTPWPTKVVFDWVFSVAKVYRLLAAGVLACAGTAMAVATVRIYRAL